MRRVERPALEGSVAVRDGRRLSYAEFGSINGPVVVWMHGTPGARRQVPFSLRSFAAERGVRVIGIDRPGIGSSTPHLYQDIVDWTPDLEIVLDRLGVEQASIAGLSGGGPYALAAGAALPDRVRSVGVMGGVAPTVGPEAIDDGPIQLAVRLAPYLKPVIRPVGFGLTNAIKMVRPLAGGVLDLYAVFQPDGDKRLLQTPEFRAMFLDDLLRGTRFQATAPLADLVLFTRDWGFRLADVGTPVHWWHGDEDRIVPVHHGEHCSLLLPDVDFTVVHGQSHLGGLELSSDVVTRLVGLVSEE
ncbi:MAG: alpha/beta fold hydrolase [Nocardioides sp.]|uniref:alpha/beta fold hydrolase n=1 Tax=Nocardioides sp. TaxID=35761 RepID=UPI003F0C2E45